MVTAMKFGIGVHCGVKFVRFLQECSTLEVK